MITNDKYLMSIANYLWKAGKEANAELKPYFHEMPENGQLPAVYFPNPSVNSRRDTLSGFAVDYTIYVKIFAVTDEIAAEIADTIQRALSFDRYKIPVIAADGTQEDFEITVNRPEISRVDTHTFQMTLRWTERNHYTEQSAGSLGEAEIILTHK